jgi:Xaa-Pro dipeptidase
MNPTQPTGAADPKWCNAQLIEHTKSAKALLNKDRARRVMDKYGLDGLVAATALNIYYLSSHRGPMQWMGRTFSTYAVFPRREDAPAALIVPGSMLYHLDQRPTWMPSVQVYSSPKQLAGALEDSAEMLPSQAATRVIRGAAEASPYVSPWGAFVREGDIRQADRILMALYAEYHGKTSASALLALKRAIKEAGLATGKLGFDDPRVLSWLVSEGLAGLRGVDALNIFREIRMVKTQNEIDILRLAALKNETALEFAIEAIRPGISLDDIELAHVRKWGELGGSSKWLIANVRGLGSGRVACGDFMKLDCVGEYLGYLGDVGRTVVCGEPTDELVHRIEADAKASRAVYSAIRPGMTFAESVEIFVDVLRQEGVARGGAAPHPVGLEHTDQPWPTGADTPATFDGNLVYEDGMVFTLDMPYHEVGWGTTHVEDMMLVRPNGAMGLSSMNTSLRVRPG